MHGDAVSLQDDGLDLSMRKASIGALLERKPQLGCRRRVERERGGGQKENKGTKRKEKKGREAMEEWRVRTSHLRDVM